MILPANPQASYLSHKEEIDLAIQKVMMSGWYILGSQVNSFEQHFADYLGTKYCVSVANGTDAIQLSLRAVGIAPGDLVITTTHTAIATVSAIDWIGAKPILVDIDPDTFTISPEKVLDTLQQSAEKIKAIIAVHIYGHPADLDALSMIAERYDLSLIEDCAQAHGATWEDKRVGAIGDCGAFSFYPTKNLGAFGDGGAIVTNSDSTFERLRLLQQYGWRERYISDEVGYNSRLDEIQAAILDCKLNYLDYGNDRRRKIAAYYNDEFADLPLTLPIERLGTQHVYHQYVVRCKDRDDLKSHLEKSGIGSSILYPVPIHLQPGYQNRVITGSGGLSISEAIAKEILCLPIYPELSDAEVDKVVNGVKSYFS